MGRLSGDLVPYISEPSASLVLALVNSARWSLIPNESLEEGTVGLRVIEVFCGKTPKAGDHLIIRGRRAADPNIRFLNLRDQWNALPFEPGNRLILAIRTIEGAQWEALAATQADPDDPGPVEALRHACEVEKTTDANKRQSMLRQALESPQDILLRYALDAMGRRKELPRDVGADMIGQTLIADRLSSDSAVTLVNELTGRYYYRYELGADKVNKLVIGVIAQLLVQEHDPKNASLWTTFLSSSLLIEFSKQTQKDKGIREDLIRAVPQQVSRQVPSILAKVALQNPKDTRIPKLLDAWNAALR